VRWSCHDAIESARCRRLFIRLLISLPLPEEAKKSLPRELEARFRSLHPLVHITSLSLGEAIMKRSSVKVITASHAKKLTDAFIRHYGEKQV